MVVPPGPHDVHTVGQLAERLRALQLWAGLSYRDLHREVRRLRAARGHADQPSLNTIHRCMDPGRTRLDADLVVDIATVLLGDPARAAEWRQAHQVASGRAAEASVVTVLPELPPDPQAFTGRQAELAAAEGTARVLLIDGMAGVGKSTFAAHLAHRLLRAGRPAELLLTVNLRGHDPERPPADPAAVLEAVLRLVGVPGSQVRSMDLARRTQRYRELVAGRRAVILLDDAAGADQVQPLLPCSEHALVLVTSRSRLTGVDGRRLPLGVFTPDDAAGYLREVLDDARLDADPASAARIADLVGHLPLGVALVASRIAATPDWSLADHLERLAEHRDSLQLEDGIELALSSSYAALPAGVRQVLRLVAMHPGRDFAPPAVAALAGLPLDKTEPALAQLAAANLLQERGPGRFGMHDLVRIHARRRARDEEAPSACRAAIGRLLDHYRYAASLAMDLYAPYARMRRPAVADPGLPVPALGDAGQATEWLEAEHVNLTAAAVAATEHGRPRHANQLAGILAGYLKATGRDLAAESLHRRAVDGADGVDRARVLEYLVITRIELGRPAGVDGLLDEAIELRRAAGDRAGEAYALNIAGALRGSRGEWRQGSTLLARSLALARAAGCRDAESLALANLATAYAELGDDEAAFTAVRQALALLRDLGNEAAQASLHSELGNLLERRGQADQAVAHFRLAHRTARAQGMRAAEATALGQLGRSAARAGDAGTAHARMTEALRIARLIGHRAQEARLLNDYGCCLQLLDRPTDAIGLHQQALAAARRSDDTVELVRGRTELKRCRAELTVAVR